MHERVAANNICFPGASFPVLAQHWRELGARRVSFTSADVFGDFAGARAALATGPYKLETILHQFHLGPLDTVTDGFREDRDKLSRAIEAAATLSGNSVYMVSGGRGKLSWEDGAQLFAEGVAPCVELAKAAGVQLIIETTMPIYADTHLGLSLDDTVELAKMAGIGVLIDIFACWTQRGFKASIERALPLCSLVQVSDYMYGDRSFPSRAVPGDGVIPLERILPWMLEAGYTGGFDLELLGPRIDAAGHLEAVRRADAHVGAILRAHGA